MRNEPAGANRDDALVRWKEANAGGTDGEAKRDTGTENTIRSPFASAVYCTTHVPHSVNES